MKMKAKVEKLTPPLDETMPAGARAHLCAIGHYATYIGLWSEYEMITSSDAEGTADAVIWDTFNIKLPGSDELAMYIDRRAGKYYLWECDHLRGNDVALAEGDTVQEVTKGWAWVLDRKVQEAILYARCPWMEEEQAKAA